jgi:hypothetical protein
LILEHNNEVFKMFLLALYIKQALP